MDRWADSRGSRRKGSLRLVSAAAALALTLAWPAPPSEAAPPGGDAAASVAVHHRPGTVIAARSSRPRARLAYTAALNAVGRLLVQFDSNSAKVMVRYKLGKKQRSVTLKVRAGKSQYVLPAGVKSATAQAKATKKLRASQRLALTPTPAASTPNTPVIPPAGTSPNTPVIPPAGTSPGTGTPGEAPQVQPLVGDINGDGIVGCADRAILQSDWGTSNARSDLNRDGTVDIADLSLLLSKWSDPVTCAPPPDSTPPGSPASLRVSSVRPDGVVLAWQNPPDADLAKVTVRRSAGSSAPGRPDQGTDVAVSGTTASDSGLQANTVYSYSVFASDRAGNSSAPARVTVTTLPTPVAEGAYSLPAGYSVEPGLTMRSPDGRYLLRNQTDGNLVEVVAESNRAVWSSNTAGAGPARLIMQLDGNLVLYNVSTMRAIWSANTAGRTSPRLDVQNDSNLVVYATGGAAWVSSTVNDQLAGGEWLHPGQAIRSRNGRYVLIQQGDGNLVVHSNGTAIWAINKLGADRSTVMQGDGNLVTYAPGTKPVWSSGTAGHNGAVTVMQDDGNLVIYSGGRALWSIRSPYPYGKIGASPAFAAVAWDVDSAMSWALGQQGTTTYEPNWCLRFTWDAYHHGKSFSGRGYLTALQAWNGNTAKHPGDRRPPYGAIVYYTSTQSAGHAALSLGDGRILSNNVGGRLGVMNLDAVSGYLGWGQFDG